MRLYLEWAEEHWEAVGLTVSWICALTVATTLIVTFNVISTRLERLHPDPAGATPPTHNERSEVGEGSGFGAAIVAVRSSPK